MFILRKKISKANMEPLAIFFSFDTYWLRSIPHPPFFIIIYLQPVILLLSITLIFRFPVIIILTNFLSLKFLQDTSKTLFLPPYYHHLLYSTHCKPYLILPSLSIKFLNMLCKQSYSSLGPPACSYYTVWLSLFSLLLSAKSVSHSTCTANIS